jgi:hypothetical protein
LEKEQKLKIECRIGTVRIIKYWQNSR